MWAWFTETGFGYLLGVAAVTLGGLVSFICSCYFKSMQDGAAIYENLAANLHQRGHRIAAVRSHAKILCFELADGRHIVIESSANLRSCRNIEQACISNDRDLLLFHRGWMLRLLEQPR